MINSISIETNETCFDIKDIGGKNLIIECGDIKITQEIIEGIVACLSNQSPKRKRIQKAELQMTNKTHLVWPTNEPQVAAFSVAQAILEKAPEFVMEQYVRDDAFKARLQNAMTALWGENTEINYSKSDGIMVTFNGSSKKYQNLDGDDRIRVVQTIALACIPLVSFLFLECRSLDSEFNKRLYSELVASAGSSECQLILLGFLSTFVQNFPYEAIQGKNNWSLVDLDEK